MVEKLQAIGVDEIACLIDFGVEVETVLSSLSRLNEVRERANATKCRSQIGLDAGHRERDVSKTAAPKIAVEARRAPAECEPNVSFPAQIERHRVTHMQCTPSLMSVWAEDPAAWNALSHLRKLMLGGEALPVPLARRLKESLPGEIYNLYGPTETTIWSTAFQFEKDEDRVCIGRPIRGTQVYILDTHGQHVPIGAAGELFIGGTGVARGYCGRPDGTAERFVPDPFGNVLGARLYRTGDLARFLPDGNIEWLGRLDHQVKIRGHRVELREIESVLAEHPVVRRAVVVIETDSPSSDPAANRPGVAQICEEKTTAPFASLEMPAAARASVGNPGGHQRLVAYVELRRTLATRDTGLMGADGSIPPAPSWRQVWDETYRQTIAPSDPAFNISGWKSSYDGSPLSPAAMREWLDHTVDRIAALRPKRILEIGCGTGLLLLRLAPQCEFYHGLDFSAEALRFLAPQVKTSGLRNVRLDLREANDFSGIEPGTFDTVILNSVIQYFPDREYLTRVLESALRVLSPGGHIFIGDVRSFPLLEPFHASVELQKAPPELSSSELMERIRARVNQEGELLVAPNFFRNLPQRYQGLGQVRIQLKQGRHRNELTAFRYDVILRRHPRSSSQGAAIVEEEACGNAECGVRSAECEIQRGRGHSPESNSTLRIPNFAFEWLDWRAVRLSLEGIRARLRASQPEHLGIAGVRNARLHEAQGAWELVTDSRGSQTANDLRSRLAQRPADGIDPEDFWDLGRELNFDVDISWSGDGSSGDYDVEFRCRKALPEANAPRAGDSAEFPNERGDFVNTVATLPILAELPDTLEHSRGSGSNSIETNEPWVPPRENNLNAALRSYLLTRLPDHMVPAAVMVLDEIPKTPNGKIDRGALPRSGILKTAANAESEPPRNALERQIAAVFQDLLRIERVGMQENFFDLGAHSLIMMQVSVRLREALDREVSLIDLFRYPTVRSLAAFFDSTTERTAECASNYDQAEKRDRARCSSVDVDAPVHA